MSAQARLDEKSARRIAAGRLALFDSHVQAVLQDAQGTIAWSKPTTAARETRRLFERAYGRWMLGSFRQGRKFGMAIAEPTGRSPGWVDIYAIVYNLRSGACHNRRVVEISGHAMARLMERRRNVDVQTLLAEELTLQRVAELIGTHKTAECFDTINGQFRLQREDDGALVATTWIPRK